MRALVFAVIAAGCTPSSPPPSSGSVAVDREALGSADPLAAFSKWVELYVNADAPTRAALEPMGRQLIGARREAMKSLIETDPQRAIELAVTPVQRDALPEDLQDAVETWRDGIGTLHVIGATPSAPLEAPPLERFVTFNGSDEVLRASVFGKRADQQTRLDVRLHGVALDGRIAVTDSRLRRLFPGEARPQLPIDFPRACPVSRKKPDSAQVYNGGDSLYGFCVAEHAEQYDGTLALGEETAAADQDLPPSSTWTEGAKTVLYVRVDFSDAPGDPLSVASAQSSINTNVNQFYVNNSFNKTSLSTVVTPTIRLPKTRAEYQTNDQYLLLRGDALTAVRDAGFNPTDYNLDIVAFASTFSGWAGRGYVGSRGTWLNGNFSLNVTAHELGHNYGLDHANYWNATGTTIIGSGSNTEYGNGFDVMGQGGGQANHFNAWFKRRLDWVTSPEVSTITTSGTSRIFELEKPISSGLHAIKVQRDASRSYWVEYRPAINTANTRDGVSINWGYQYNTGSHLLDMTPGDGSRSNSTLIIGRTFSDRLADVHLTPIGKGGTMPESIDMVVNLGPFPGNRAPTLTLAASTQTPLPAANVTFTATASDPDGDALAYAWDFGDGTWGPNANVVTHAFSAGEYSVRLVVSDMKGQTVSKAITITAGTASAFTLSGTVLVGTTPLADVRISDGTRATFTSSDGTYALTSVPAGSVTVTATLPDFTFTRSFAAPLAVSASQSGLDFTATAVAGYAIRGKVTFNGTGLAGVTITDGARTATTNSSGDYALTPLPTGRYTLSASKPGWQFVQSGVPNPVEVFGGDTTGVNFFSTGQTLSGQIPMAGVTTAPVVTDGVRTVTATNGGTNWFYYLSSVPNGVWNVVASSPGVTLTPSTFSNPVTVQGTSMGNLNFSVTSGTTYTISGTVRTGGTPLPNVVVSDGTHTATTDSLGVYTLVNVAPGTWTLTPTRAGYTFVPASLAVTVGSANVTGRDFATTVVNAPPTVVTAASASPNPVMGGTSTVLSVLGNDDSGESALTYTWNVTGGYPVSYSANGTNAAKNATVTFTGASTYTFECVITDPGGLSVRSSVVVSVTQVQTGLDITPASATLMPGAMQLFQSTQRDQFNRAMFAGTPAWTLSGGGTMTPSGTVAQFTAGSTPGGPHTLSVQVGTRTATAQIIIAGSTVPIVTAVASATPNPVSGTTTSLAVRATDDQPESQLTYTWMASLAPSPVMFSSNGDNAAKNTTVTFAEAGDYTFTVTVADQQGNTATSSVDVTVQATPTTLDVQPRQATVRVGTMQTFTATVTDQFAQSLSPQPMLGWTVSGGGTVDGAGVFTAGATAGGPFTLTAASGALSASAQVTVDTPPDTQPPMVTLTAPIANARELTGFTITADATDDVGVTQVEFFADGTTALGSASASPWTVMVAAGVLSNGTHVLTARAVDAAGNAATSDGVTIIVGPEPTDMVAPTVTLTQPSNAETPLAVTFGATANDDVGVVSVDFELDGSVVGAGALSSGTWTLSNTVSEGAHVLVAIARDAAGNSARSNAFSFTASADVEPEPMTPPVPELVSGSCGCTTGDASLAIVGLITALLRSRRRATR
ncbi:MAG: PKD domain-containing protein [Archangium sp.]